MQCQLGRAWYEMVDYAQAKAAFEKARRQDPQRLEVTHIHPVLSPTLMPWTCFPFSPSPLLFSISSSQGSDVVDRKTRA